MEQQARIVLTPEQETLLIPLCCKAREDNPVFDDAKAREILLQLDYDFRALRIPRKTCVMMWLRAQQFDEYAREFIGAHRDAVVVDLGCGLDSRCIRVEPGEVRWYDLDLPEVIALRRRFFAESDTYQMLSSSASELAWMRSVSATGRPVLVIAEGLVMYLSEEEVRGLVLGLADAFPGCNLAFDAFSRLTARRVQAHPSIRSTGAHVLWGIDDPHEIERWSSAIHLKEERYFPQFSGMDRLSFGYRLAFRLSGLVPAVRRAHRMLYYTL